MKFRWLSNLFLLFTTSCFAQLSICNTALDSISNKALLELAQMHIAILRAEDEHATKALQQLFQSTIIQMIPTQDPHLVNHLHDKIATAVAQIQGPETTRSIQTHMPGFNTQAIKDSLVRIKTLLTDQAHTKDSFEKIAGIAVQTNDVFTLNTLLEYRNIKYILFNKHNNPNIKNAILELLPTFNLSHSDFEQNWDINSQDYDFKRGLLFRATSLNKTTIALLLIQNGADVNLQDEFYTTPLHNAFSFKNLQVIYALLNANAAVNLPSPKQESPLHQAIKYLPSKDLLNLFRHYKINPNSISNAESLLMTAAQESTQKNTFSASTITALLELGANIHYANPNTGETALHRVVFASYSNHQSKAIHTLKVLLEAGAQIDHASHDNETAFIKAIQLHRLEIAEFLLENGANPTIIPINSKAMEEVAKAQKTQTFLEHAQKQWREKRAALSGATQ